MYNAVVRTAGLGSAKAPVQGKSEGLFLYVRHSTDCRYYPAHCDRNESRRCNCVKYIRGTAADGTRVRQSTGTASWEKARAQLARLITEHDPKNKLLVQLTTAVAGVSEKRQTLKEAITQFIDTKRGENLVDVTHYEGTFERELLPWCKQRGIRYVDELTLELVTKFRNSLHNLGTVKNRKLSRLRSFFEFCLDRGWVTTNVAKKIKRSQEDEPDVDYFSPEEMHALGNACFVSHTWERGRDYEYRDKRLRAFILFARWTGLSIIDCVRFERYRLQQNSDGVWTVLLRRMKNNNPVFVAIPQEVVDALNAIPPMSDTYFFWSGNGRPQTAVRGWRRSLAHVFEAAKLRRNGKPLHCHPHMFRHTFAVEKLLSGTSLEDVSLLLGHSSTKVTERHYLKFDQRRQDRLIKASMNDWHQIHPPASGAKKKRPKLVVMSKAAGK